MFERIRTFIYRFARDHIAPSSPIEKPDVGVVSFRDGVMHGQYAGEVSIPPLSGVTDATALALLLSAQWVAAFAEKRGVERTVLESSNHHFVVKWTVEFTESDTGETAIVADPEGIRALVESMLDAVEPEHATLDPEPPRRDGVVLSIQDARKRLRGKGDE